MNAIDIENHPAVNNAIHMRTISRPLNKIGITYFSHVRQYKDGRFAGLASSPEFSVHYLKNQYYNVDLHTVSNKYGDLVIWDHLERAGLSKKMHAEAAAFGVKHTFSIIEKTLTYTDVYHFATDVNDTYINQIYLTKLHYLKQFISHYKDMLNQDPALLSMFNSHILRINTQIAGYRLKDEESLLNYLNEPLISLDNPTNQMVLECRNPITLIHYETQRHITLTLQQSKCLFGILQGKTAKEIGKLVNLSYRTVEHYLERVRFYLGCKSNKEVLIRYANQISHWL